MQFRRKSILTVSLIALLAVAFSDAAAAKSKKAQDGDGAAGVKRDLDGTPTVEKDSHSGKAAGKSSRKRAYRSLSGVRGSGGIVSPSLGAASRGSTLPAPSVQVYKPPPITTYGDRATNAIQSYPLERGIGNNPSDMQGYIRQKANGP